MLSRERNNFRVGLDKGDKLTWKLSRRKQRGSEGSVFVVEDLIRRGVHSPMKGVKTR